MASFMSSMSGGGAGPDGGPPGGMNNILEVWVLNWWWQQGTC